MIATKTCGAIAAWHGSSHTDWLMLQVAQSQAGRIIMVVDDGCGRKSNEIVR